MTTLDDAVTAGDRVTALAVAPEAIGIAGEVLQTLKRHPDRHMSDGTGHDRAGGVYVAALQRMNDNRLGCGPTWARLLLEQVARVVAEQPESPELRHLLLEVSTVAQQWVHDIDCRERELPSSPLRWGPGRGLTG